ncbi:MAG TPA: mobile mystery protein A [Kofleriaceae bacterium]|nr:mobile mystery protein A [Kofleriaceae bacterium]
MGHSKETQALRRRQLDRKLGRIDVAALQPPPEGWVRATRQALGINGRQLAERLGVSRSQVSHIERAERSMELTMQTLVRVAEGLECNLVYALVPRRGSLEETVNRRARKVATSLVERIAGSMALEAQPTDVEERERLIDSTAADLVRTLDKSLWDVEP